MASLTDQLVVQVAADISAFKKDMATVRTDLDKTAKTSQVVGTEAEKAAKKASGGFKEWRSQILFVRANLLLVAAAATAIVTPILQAEDAMKEFNAVAKSSGKPFQDLEKNTRKAADESGQSIATFADGAKNAMNKYGLSANTSLAATKAAFRAAKLEIFSYEEAIGALAPIMTRFGITNIDAEDALALIQTAARETGKSLGEMAGLLVALAPKAKKSGTDLHELASSIIFLEKRGFDADQAIDAIAGTLDQLGKKKPFDGVDPWAVYYSGLGSAVDGTNSLADSLQILFDAAGSGNAALAESVTGSADLASAFEDGAENGFAFASAVTILNKGIDAMPEIINEVNGSLDKMIELMHAASNAASAPFISPSNWKFDKENNSPPIGAGFATGGIVPGTGTGDTVPAWLTPGEFVIRKEVAAKLMPFLSKLNAAGISQTELWNTPLAGTRVGGKSVLELLGVEQSNPKLGQRIGANASIIPGQMAMNNRAIAEIVSQMRNAIGYANGGPVKAAGPSHSTSIGSVNMNVSGADLISAAGRRQVVSLIEREARAGRSPTGRSGR